MSKKDNNTERITYPWLFGSYFLDLFDLIIWFYNQNPERFKEDFIALESTWYRFKDQGSKPGEFIIPLSNLSRLHFYFYQSFSQEIQGMIQNSFKLISPENFYQEIKNNFGQKKNYQFIKRLLLKHSSLRDWIINYQPEFLFHLVEARQRELLKIFLKNHQSKIRLLTYSRRNLLEYALSLKHGAPLENIIQDLRRVFGPSTNRKNRKKRKNN